MLYLTFITQTAKERGAGLAEYALLLALIAVVCIGALTTLQGGISAVLNSVGATLSGV